MNAGGGMRNVWVVLGMVVACGPTNDRPRDDGGAGADGGSGTGGVTGAGDGDVAPTSYESGTRIKARKTTVTVTSPDGARSVVETFGGWYDAQRSEACTPGQAGDGKTRCLPAATAANPSYFADSACMIPVALVAQVEGCAVPVAPTYISVSPPPSCTPSVTDGTRLHHPGPPQTSFFLKSGANCSMNTFPGYAFYPPGAEVLPTEFAEMTTTAVTQ